MFLYMVDGWKVVDQKPAWNIDGQQLLRENLLGGFDSSSLLRFQFPVFGSEQSSKRLY